MKRITYYDADGIRQYVHEVTGIRVEPSRTTILLTFANDPKLAYFETNVRRYTAADVYAGRRGQAI